MSDLIVLICILWATAMTGVAWHFYTWYRRALKAGAHMCTMLVCVALGKATLEKNANGEIVFEDDERKLTIGVWEDE
jgi:hypothetical protein